ncbi:hypothetical protein BC829DRAFT_304660 [Chytridium lagenaria]|nr:hypothetical protein BC829DRAFT_304660 [Chytridium lagenaria]
MEEEEPTGYVRYDRFLPVALSVCQSEECGPSDEERIFRAFQTLDIERKGYLTPDELRRFLMTDGSLSLKKNWRRC